MMSRKELESLLGEPLTDEQWQRNLQIFAEMADREWEAAHPMDE